ncbi:HNH endonuclease [Methylomonas sp. EbB]|uniref:HNH endonuclease n=2 Tax=Methylomonas fluvii TaxID=1854564 RepID=A0ABR9DGV3_9GAMM|nr:HNH endonuclease signature motif containing protein [Methylomonas fluvii]MBD9362326.1 HNH endonuclease [Methylomonas fluvii]
MLRLSRLLSLVFLVYSVTTIADDIPDLAKTPGVTRLGLTKTKVCSIKWGADERHVTPNMKKQVFAAYGYSGYDDPRCTADAHGKTCEIDHLISRELGGADDVNNLWPQAYGGTPWNAHLKDKLENRLNKEVCAGRLSLKTARQMLVNDWRNAYVQYYGKVAG